MINKVYVFEKDVVNNVWENSAIDVGDNDLHNTRGDEFGYNADFDNNYNYFISRAPSNEKLSFQLNIYTNLLPIVQLMIIPTIMPSDISTVNPTVVIYFVTTDLNINVCHSSKYNLIDEKLRLN